MPFIDAQRYPQDLTNIAGPEPIADPSLVQTFEAAFRTENMVGSYLASRGMPDPRRIEEGFNAIDYVKDEAEFAPYVREFAGVFNKEAADALKLQIKREQQDRRTIEAAGGMGTVASLAAGVIDIPTLLPVFGGGMAGGSVLRTATGAAIGAAMDATVSETGLQLTQITRTGEETAYNIGGSILLGGALGTLVGRYLSTPQAVELSRKIERSEAEYDAVDGALFSSGKGVSAGAAARDAGPLRLKDEDLIKKIPVVNRQDPMIRLQLSDYDSARQTVRGLAETPLEYADNAKGVATEIGGSVETRMKMWHAPLARTLTEIDTAYAKYFNNAPEPSSWQVRLSPLKSEFQRLTGGQKLTYKQFKEEVGKAAFSGEQHAIPEIAEAARFYRQLDDAMKQAAIDARLFPEDIAVQGDVSHLFRMYNKEKIISRRGEFGRILEDYFVSKRDAAAKIGEAENLARKASATARRADAKVEEFSRLSDQEVRELVEETIDTILGNADGRIPYDSIVSGPRGPLKERLLHIESAKIQDFLNLDIEEVMRAQVRTMSADVELSKKFGTPDLAEEIRKINDEASRKIAAVDGAKDKDGKPLSADVKEKQRRRLDKQRKEAIRDVEGIRDRLRGQYALPANPDSLVLRAGRVARNLNYLRLMGGMTISAIPDLAKVIYVHGLTSTFRDGFLPMIQNLKGFKLAADEVKAAGTALDMVLDSRAMAIADITDDFGRHSAFERGLTSMNARFGVVSLMAPWNAAMKQFSGLVTMTNIVTASKRVGEGTASKADIRKLAASGIDADIAARITKQFAEHGELQNGVTIPGGAKWTDRQALEAFRAAVVRDVDRIVVTPGQDKPLWMSTELGKAVSQFRSFNVSSMQKTVLAGLQQRDAANLTGSMAMLGLGALTYWIKQVAADRPLSDNPAVWATNALDWSGLIGWASDANAISEKFTRGRVGLSAFTGEQVSRYASRNVTGAFLGPSADAIADIFQVSGSIFAGDMTKGDLRRARQLLPMQNLFYIRNLINQVEEAAGDALGLPETSRR